MTKKQNTLVFILVGTLGNILLTFILIVILTLLGGLLFKENVGTALPFIFIAALIGGMFLYQKIANRIIKKFNLEDKMAPLFGSKYKRNRLD